MTGLLRALLLTGGTISVGLAIAGAVLPLVPATPFLLIAAYCYARSSERAHRWLMTHRIMGPYISNFQQGRSHSKLQIAATLGALWISTLITAIFIVDAWLLRVLFLVPTSLLTAYMLVRTWRARRGRRNAEC